MVLLLLLSPPEGTLRSCNETDVAVYSTEIQTVGRGKGGSLTTADLNLRSARQRLHGGLQGKTALGEPHEIYGAFDCGVA